MPASEHEGKGVQGALADDDMGARKASFSSARDRVKRRKHIEGGSGEVGALAGGRVARRVVCLGGVSGRAL